MVTIIIMSLLLLASVSLNVALFYYARRCVEKLVSFHEGVDDLQNQLEEYSEYCYSLSRSESLFNDPLIVKLYEQTKQIVDKCDEFKDSFTVIYDEEEELEEGTTDE